MITVTDAFKKFKSRLELTDREQKDASRRQTDIREFLRAEFEIEKDFLTGSYARSTKTKPLKDVDIFFVLGEEEAGYRDKKPSVILERLRDVLSQRYGERHVSPGRRSVQVDFGIKTVEEAADSQVMSVDVVPAFTASSHYQIPDRTIEKWVATDPEVHAELATKANKAFSEEWKPLVKMTKKWNEASDKPVKPGFLLEVMALELLVPPFSGGYPYELKGFFASATDRISEVWPDPANLGPPVSDQMDTRRVHQAETAFRDAEKIASRAILLTHDGRESDALQVWRNLFGPLFPLS